MLKSKKIFILCSIIFLIISGCTLSLKKKVPVENKNLPNGDKNLNEQNLNQSLSEKLDAQSKIKKFTNYDELKEFLENNINESGVYGYGSGIAQKTLSSARVMEELSATDSIAAPGAAADLNNETKQSGSTDYSKTNIQVEGVDEADIIKTDGKYIYAVARNNLFIISALPANEAEVLAKIEFKARPSDIYVNGSFLVIYGDDQEIFNREFYKTFRRRNSYVFLKIFDISDPKNPKQVRDLDLEGSYSNSRMIGDYIYFVTSNYNYYYIADEPIIPRVIENGEVLASKCVAGAKCFAPSVYYFDIPYDNYNFTTVTSINLKDASSSVNGEVYMLSGNQNMYVSLNNIYITYTKYISEYDLMMEVLKEMIMPKLSAKDQERITKIEQTEDFILNKTEKIAKIGMIIERYRASLTEEEQNNLEKELEVKMKQKYEDISKELEKTVIHKIAIDNGRIEYRAQGEVTGSVLNQFSMDEANGYFRIATTKNRTWSQFTEGDMLESYNNLFVLDENLKVVGSLEKLASSERIYSVRFMQNRAYMVTFKQIDPLFVIDLSVPQNPKVLGELKIPGFSNYLHPYDETTLIGLGKDASENEWGGITTKGIKISLFDVSDVSNPKEITNYTMGDSGSDSMAIHDHKAFLFSKEKNLLVIPVSINESVAPNKWGKLVFSGAAVFSIDKNNIELKGKIDHSDGGQPAIQDYWGGYNYYDNTVKRSLYIDNNLYTFSNYYLKVNQLDNLEQINSISLQKEMGGDDFRVIN